MKREVEYQSRVDHPLYYGGDTTYEAIKVIEAWELNFSLGSVLKYISRAGKKVGAEDIHDLEKAKWYLTKEIERRAFNKVGGKCGRVIK